MGCRYTISGIFMHFLIILCTIQSRVLATDSHEDGSSVLRLHSMDDQVQQAAQKHGEGSHDHLAMSYMDHMNPSLSVFLVEKNLKLGNSMPIYFPAKDPSSLYHLPREEANSIPFSSDRLAEILRIFSIQSGSTKAMAMSNTLTHCESESIDGETKFCATSFEAMLDFVRDIFGKGVPFKFLRTTHNRKPTGPSGGLHNYTMVNISREIAASTMVACHTMPYPYTVFYCHHQVKKSKVYKVSLLGEYDEEVDAIVVCHMDTSAWDPLHASFQMLGIKPGTDPVCHFFPEDNLVWIPLSSVS